VKVVKNKCAHPFTEAEFDIRWGIGIDAPTDLLDVAEASGVVQKTGAHYTFGGKSFAQGRDKARDALLASGDLGKALLAELAQTLPSLARRLEAGARAA
jgi:recombination protein RecA